MKNLFYLILVISFNVNFLSGNDSISRKHRFFISTYTSNLFVGDVSLGAEFAMRKLGGEIIFMKKLFETKYHPFYDKGFRITSYFKYKILHKKKFAINADFGLTYRKEFFENKNLNLYFLNSFSNNTDASLYNQNFTNLFYGMSFGTSTLLNVFKKINVGLNLNIDLLNVKETRQINYHFSGEEYRNNPNWPSQISKDFPISKTYNYKNFIYPNFLIKISYEI